MRKLALALGLGAFTSLALAATATDYAIDAKQAMLFGDKAPLAARATASPDESATWAYVPRSPTKKDFRLLAYFHGWEGFVLVDKKGVSAKPDWWPGEIGGTRASGLKYGIGAAVEGFPGTVALCPEDGIPDTGKDTTAPDPKDATRTITRHKGPHHANTDSGSLAKADGLAAWVDQCCAHLAALRSSQGAYLSAALSSADLHHLYLSGHSAGGKPLAACAASELVRKVPTDLWLLDCTYGWGNKEYPDFCDAMKASLGNAKDKSRLVGIAIKSNGSGTAEDMKKVIAGIKAKGLHVDEVDYAAPSDLGAVVTALSGSPIVVIWVGKEDWAKKESWGTFRDCNVPDHDRIPAFFLPILLATAEGRKPSPLPTIPPPPPP